MNLSDMSSSTLLASDDYAVGTTFPLLKIEKITTEEVPRAGSTKREPRVTIWFSGAAKGWVANKTEARKMAKIIGSTQKIEQTWIGTRVALKVVGDIRRPDGTKGNAFRIAECLPAENKPGSKPESKGS